jgi:hypothetical protein
MASDRRHRRGGKREPGLTPLPAACITTKYRHGTEAEALRMLADITENGRGRRRPTHVYQCKEEWGCFGWHLASDRRTDPVLDEQVAALRRSVLDEIAAADAAETADREARLRAEHITALTRVAAASGMTGEAQTA